MAWAEKVSGAKTHTDASKPGWQGAIIRINFSILLESGEKWYEVGFCGQGGI